MLALTCKISEVFIHSSAKVNLYVLWKHARAGVGVLRVVAATRVGVAVVDIVQVEMISLWPWSIKP